MVCATLRHFNAAGGGAAGEFVYLGASSLELLDHYVDLVLLGWQSLFVDAIQDAREVEHERVCAQAIIKSVTSTWAMIAGLLNVSCVLLGGSLFGTSITPGETSPPALSSPGLIVAVCQTTSLTCAVAFFTVLFPKLCRTQIALQRMVDLLVSQDRDACDPVKSHATFHVEGQEGAGGLLEQTCLLYTSPSPRDGLLSRMPSSA